jgi:hypothetical protein
MQSEYTKKFKCYLDGRKCISHQRVVSRKRGIADAFSGAEVSLDSELLSNFVAWLADIQQCTEYCLLWGSYVLGNEASHSFMRIKDSYQLPGYALCGPSDIDGLLVVNSKVERPSRMEEYAILSSDLSFCGRTSLDLFRDLIVLREEEVECFLSSCSLKHRCLYAISHLRDGLILVNGKYGDEICLSASPEIDVYSVSEDYRADKRRFLEGVRIDEDT